MSITADQPLGPDLDPSEGVAGVPPNLSVLEHVKQVQRELADKEREPLVVVIPEWEGALAVQFRYPEQGATPIIRAGLRMAGLKPERALDSALDVIVGAAWDVVGRRPADGDWTPLDPSGERTRIGSKLAGLLGWDVPSEVRAKGRYVARLLWSPKARLQGPSFGKYEGDLALVSAAGDVTDYLRGVQDEIQGELEGE